METETSFGALISRRRKALGLLQKELALQVGCSVTALRIGAGDAESALELVLHVLQEKVRTQDLHNRAEHLRVEWEARLSAQHIDVIRARVQGKALDAVVQDLLDAR